MATEVNRFIYFSDDSTLSLTGGHKELTRLMISTMSLLASVSDPSVVADAFIRLACLRGPSLARV